MGDEFGFFGVGGDGEFVGFFSVAFFEEPGVFAFEPGAEEVRVVDEVGFGVERVERRDAACDDGQEEGCESDFSFHFMMP